MTQPSPIQPARRAAAKLGRRELLGVTAGVTAVAVAIALGAVLAVWPSELRPVVQRILVYGVALTLGIVGGYGFFRLTRGPWWPILWRPFAFALGFGAAVLIFGAALSVFQRVGAHSPEGASATQFTMDPFKTIALGILIAAAILALLRRLPRKRPPGESRPSGPDMTTFAP